MGKLKKFMLTARKTRKIYTYTRQPPKTGPETLDIRCWMKENEVLWAGPGDTSGNQALTEAICRQIGGLKGRRLGAQLRCKVAEVIVGA